MRDFISRDHFLSLLHRERAAWDGLISGLDPAQMSQPGVCNEWSVKDTIAHIIFFEKEIIGMLKARALAGSDLWDLPADERNAVIFQQNRHLSMEKILADSAQTYHDLHVQLESLPSEAMTDPKCFPGMPADWQPWKIIAENTFEHYTHHAADIRSWLRKRGPGKHE